MNALSTFARLYISLSLGHGPDTVMSMQSTIKYINVFACRNSDNCTVTLVAGDDDATDAAAAAVLRAHSLWEMKNHALFGTAALLNLAKCCSRNDYMPFDRTYLRHVA